MKTLKKLCLTLTGLFIVTFLSYAAPSGFDPQPPAEKDIYQNSSEEVKNRILTAVELINQGKFNSAEIALGENDSPYIIEKRVELYTQYFVQSIMHQIFCLTDLTEDQNLNELRRDSVAGYTATTTKLDDLITASLEENPDDPVLHMAAGIYYYDTLLRYNDQWIESVDTLVDLSLEHLGFAYENGVYNRLSLTFYAGCIYNEQNDFESALEIYTLITELYPEDADGWFNKASCNYSMGNYQAIPEDAEKAISLYTNVPYYAMDSYRLLITAYSKIQDEENYLQATERAISAFPEEPSYYYDLAEHYFLIGQLEEASKCLAKAFPLGTTRYLYSNWQDQNYGILQMFIKAYLSIGAYTETEALCTLILETDDDPYRHAVVQYFYEQVLICIAEFIPEKIITAQLNLPVLQMELESQEIFEDNNQVIEELQGFINEFIEMANENAAPEEDAAAESENNTDSQ